jgi:hypothetical protein
MTSTNRTTIATRISHCLAATALMAGLTIGATAGAAPVWDLDAFDKCLANSVRTPLGDDPEAEWTRRYNYCCIASGGELDSRGICGAPAPAAQDVPHEPGQTTTPPVLDPGQTGPSNPLIPTPRGPNSGTFG